MALIKYPIEPRGNLTAIQRAESLSMSLWNIVRPTSIRAKGELTTHLFSVIAHPSEALAVMFVPDNFIIVVHPDANINEFVSLFPHLSLSARVELSNYLSQSAEFNFESVAFLFGTPLTDQDMEEYYQ